MQVKDIMTKNVITVSVDDLISDVAKKLSEKRIHGVLVVEGKHLVGIITETDFFTKGEVEMHLPTYLDVLKNVQQNKEGEIEMNEILNIKAGDIMTTNCITVNPEDDVKKLVACIRENDLHTVPVAIGDIVEGVVTVADVIRLL